MESHGKIMEFLYEIAFWMSVAQIFLARFSSLNIFQKYHVFIFEQSNPKPSVLHHKTSFHIYSIIYATYLFLPFK